MVCIVRKLREVEKVEKVEATASDLDKNFVKTARGSLNLLNIPQPSQLLSKQNYKT
jgi:hypothetical protein